MMKRHPLRSLPRLLLAVLCFSLAATFASGAKSITQHGITWTFDRDYRTGQFANGDWWVVGPVRITAISPRSVVQNGATLHGSMINPAPNTAHGFDSRIRNNTYKAALNVGLKLPLFVATGSSLLSSASHSAKTSGDNPQLKTIAILTVLAKAPAAGSFRPPYVGSDKSVRWNRSQLDVSRLQSLPRVASTPSLAKVEGAFARPWIELKTNWTGRYLHPSDNQPAYGREMANTLANGLLSLHLNYTRAQKEKLLVRLVQYGIDVYGAARAGARWSNDGGHNQGRKMPLLLAGITLKDPDILAYGHGKSKRIFQEDQQTWYVTSSDVGRPLYTGDGRRRDRYTSQHVGLAEWGEKHFTNPSRDGSNWGVMYRDNVGGATLGHVLAARLMKAEKEWAWPAMLDYSDRYWGMVKGKAPGSGNLIRPFPHAMWKAYRNSVPTTFTPESTSTEDWSARSLGTQTGKFTVTFTCVPSKAKMDGVTGVSFGVPDSYADLAASIRFAPSGFIDAFNGNAYQAAATQAYRAGVTYRFVMTVNFSRERYSVKVTPKGGTTVLIAKDWVLRPSANQQKVSHLGSRSLQGAHSVKDVAVQ